MKMATRPELISETCLRYSSVHKNELLDLSVQAQDLDFTV